MAKKSKNKKSLFILFIIAGICALAVIASIWMPFEVIPDFNDKRSGFDYLTDEREEITIKIYLVFTLILTVLAVIAACIGAIVPKLEKRIPGFALLILGLGLSIFALLTFFKVETSSSFIQINRGVGVYINIIFSLIMLGCSGYICYKEM